MREHDHSRLKACRKCGIEKQFTNENFRLVREKRSGREYTYIKNSCRPCEIQDRMAYYRLNEITEKYKRRQWMLYPVVRNQRLKWQYGITLEEYNELLRKQGGVCLICEAAPAEIRNGKIVSFPVDHDHKTGKVRGILCGFCNRGLGSFKDSKEFLERAIKYLDGSL
jgi:recombination endonuclease VII